MKKLILFLLIFSPEFAKACAKKIDASKVMLFVDTNNSELEIATTEKAACARGERLVVVPKNFKDYAKFTTPVEVANKKLAKLKCFNNPSPDCTAAQGELNIAQSRLNEFKYAQKSTSEGVKEALAGIKASKGKLQNLSISGHDGGGNFGGVKGSYNRRELAETMKEYADINEVKSLMLLGCYTGTQHEVLEWRNIFPQVKVIGGYDGSAPLADRPQGHQYISDILTKEKQLTAQADQKKLQAYVDANLKGLGSLNGALFLQCSDGSTTHDYYYGSKKSRKIENFDMKECLEKKQELISLAEELNKYLSGELEPPTDTQNGALRGIYNKARALEHCVELTGINVNTNAAFNLLFYAGVKESFGKFYKDDLKEAEEIIESITLEEMEKNFANNQSKAEKLIAEYDQVTGLLKSNPEEYFAKQEKEMQDLKAKFDALLKDPKNADLKSYFEGATSGGGYGMGMALNLPTEADRKRFQTVSEAFYKYSDVKETNQREKAAPDRTVQMREQATAYRTAVLRNQAIAFWDLKENLKDPKNKIWSLTSENLKKYSRKELLANIHRMNGYMTAGVLTTKQAGTLAWLNSVQMNHIQSFYDNPFSWHEFTGHVEKPRYVQKLKDYQNGIGAGGYGGGFGGGEGGHSGGSQGGIVGGMSGGF
jgi:hypothetical protein